MRIVSLLPSATEICFALGGGREVVGVTFECDYPSEARTSGTGRPPPRRPSRPRCRPPTPLARLGKAPDVLRVPAGEVPTWQDGNDVWVRGPPAYAEVGGWVVID